MAVKKTIKPKSKRASPSLAASTMKTAANAAEATPTPSHISLEQSEYAIGDRISHPMFGHGTVAAIDVHTLTIEFGGNVVKQILDGYVKPRKP
jgi:hypothetical protein